MHAQGLVRVCHQSRFTLCQHFALKAQPMDLSLRVMMTRSQYLLYEFFPILFIPRQVMPQSNCTTVNESFVPAVRNCSSELHFTLFFKETLFTISPFSLLFLLTLFRVNLLRKSSAKISKHWTSTAKLVGHLCVPSSRFPY